MPRLAFVAVPEVSAPDLLRCRYHPQAVIAWTRRSTPISFLLPWLTSRATTSPKAAPAIAVTVAGSYILFVAACALPDFVAAVACYPDRMFEAWGGGATPFDQLGRLTCPVIGFFGNDDRNPSPQDADKLDAELTRS